MLTFGNKTFGQPSKVKPLPDNGVPGPGNYDPKPGFPIPSFKICKATEINEK